MNPSRIRQMITWLQAMLPKVQSPVVKKPARPKPAPGPFKTLFGIDAESTPSNRALNSAGIRFVIRYISTPGNPKNITKSEIRRLRKAGKGIVIVFETAATRSLDGYQAGVDDARSALRQLAQLGLHDGAVYFAVDFEPTDGQLDQIVHYFQGIRAGGITQRGCYGGYAIIRHLFGLKQISYGYQTYAWSNGLRDTRAQLYQFSNDHTIGGVSVDFDRAYVPDYGQAH